MKLAEAIVYLLASSGHGMRTEQIAREINARSQGKRVEYLEEKASNPCFCAIYFLSLRNLWIVRHERI